MKFIHITDPHLVSAGRRPYGIEPNERFEACLADIAAHHADAAFCVITGDLAEYGDIATYEGLKARLARFPFKVHLLLGNCDDRGNFLSVFGGTDEPGFVQSASRYGDSRHLFLDTLGEAGSAAGRYDMQRRSWLSAQLAEAMGSPVYIYMHHPPFDIGHTNDSIKLEEGEAFGDLLTGHAIRHIFFGHTHRPVSGEWRGIGFSGLPGLPFQIPLVAGSVPTRTSDEPPMYAVVLLGPTSLTVHFDCFLHRAPLEI